MCVTSRKFRASEQKKSKGDFERRKGVARCCHLHRLHAHVNHNVWSVVIIFTKLEKSMMVVMESFLMKICFQITELVGLGVINMNIEWVV